MEFNNKKTETKPDNETELEKKLRQHFKDYSNSHLVQRANSLPDFQWDDEEAEIVRRMKRSNGKFVVKMQGSTLVILKNEQ